MSATVARSQWFVGVVRKGGMSALVRIKKADGGTSVLRVPTTSLVERAARESRKKRTG